MVISCTEKGKTLDVGMRSVNMDSKTDNNISSIKKVRWIKPRICATMIRMNVHCGNTPKHINSGVELETNRRILFWVCCLHYNPSLREEPLETIFG